MHRLAMLVSVCLAGNALSGSAVAGTPRHQALAPDDRSAAMIGFITTSQPSVRLAQAGSIGGSVAVQGKTAPGGKAARRPRALGSDGRGRKASRAAASRGSMKHLRRTTGTRSKGRCVSGTFAGYSGRICF
jgi:hypothetical protein